MAVSVLLDSMEIQVIATTTGLEPVDLEPVEVQVDQL
jgi:hypothetical protein